MPPPRHRFSVRPEAASNDLAEDTERPYWFPKSPVTPSWVILSKMARVSIFDPPLDFDLPAASGLLRLELAPPPRVTFLDVPPVIFPATPTAESSPRVLAAEGGFLLLHADQGRAKGHMVLIDLPGRQEFVSQAFIRDFFVLDGHNGRVHTLPNPHYILEPAFLGIIPVEFPVEGRRHDFMTVELQYKKGKRATLLCLSTTVGEWVEKRVTYPLPRRLTPDVVIAHAHRLWWVDLSWCILACDPFADAPVLSVVALPPGKEIESRKGLDKDRWVGVSEGKLRFVEIERKVGAEKITVWSLNDNGWEVDQETSFAKVWDDGSYKAIHLPRTVPTLALLDPIKGTIIFLLHEKTLYSVDMVTCKVIGCDVLQLPTLYATGSNLFCNWKLGRSLCWDNKSRIAMNPWMTHPEDLVSILSKLSFKDFCRFKCVCKSWRDIASDPLYSKSLPMLPAVEPLGEMEQILWGPDGPQ